VRGLRRLGRAGLETGGQEGGTEGQRGHPGVAGTPEAVWVRYEVPPGVTGAGEAAEVRSANGKGCGSATHDRQECPAQEPS